MRTERTHRMTICQAPLVNEKGERIKKGNP